MSDLPFMMMYCEKFFAATDLRLTGEQAAYYNILLQRAWINGGWLPDDDRMLAFAARVSPRKWAELKGPIMAYWHKDELGRWTQKTLAKVREDAEKRVMANRANGAKGGRPKLKSRGEVGEKSARSREHVGHEVERLNAKKHNDFNETENPTVTNGFDNKESESDLKKESSSSESGAQARDDDDRIFKGKVREALGPKTAELVASAVVPALRVLIADGCDFERDILPKLRDIATTGLKTPAPAFLGKQIRERRDARLAADAARGSAAPPTPQVFVRAHTPQWRAWEAHTGRRWPTSARNGSGWYFASEWPPGAEPDDEQPPAAAAPRFKLPDMGALLAHARFDQPGRHTQ